MGGKAHGGRRISQTDAINLYRDLTGRSDNGLNYRHLLCGSARRNKPDCGDLDIVVVPARQHEFDEFCIGLFGHQKSGKPARTGLVDGVQVEFYLATAENWGSQIQMWTGSHVHNIKLRRLAKAKGYSLSQYGFKHQDTGDRVFCPQERDVYNFLEIDYVQPWDR